MHLCTVTMHQSMQQRDSQLPSTTIQLTQLFTPPHIQLTPRIHTTITHVMVVDLSIHLSPIVRRAERSCWYIFWNEDGGWYCSTLKVTVAFLKLIQLANRKPTHVRKNRWDAIEPSVLGNHSSKCILDKLKASQN